MNTPYVDLVAGFARRGPRFFMPGHKGNPAALPFLAGAAHLDVTELADGCDLQRPGGALAESEAAMARAYQSGATLYSASGSTSCIVAMLALFVGRGGRVVMARGCHVAAVRALALLGAVPFWVPLRGGRPQAEDVEAALVESGAGAVCVTALDYYGRMADIGAIAAACHRHGAVLLCDNAHGAHLPFMAQNRHPLALGADAAADSAHKTLPCLTPAAMLHLRDGALCVRARQALNLFTSTSPSHLVLQSMDWAAGLLNSENPPDFEGAAARCALARARFGALCEACDDPLRLVLVPAAAGVDAAAFQAALLAAGIAAEYFDGQRLVLMASPWNTEQDYCALEDAVHEILQTLPQKKGVAAQAPPVPGDDFFAQAAPEAVRTVRAAVFGESEAVPAEKAAGRVMAGLLAPCPPGVPPVVPGQRVSAAAAALYAGGGVNTLFVLK